ncbi:MAG: ATP-binding protein, partial [bacterium]
NPRHTTVQRAKRVDDFVSWGATRPFCITLDLLLSDGSKYRLEKDWAIERTRMTHVESGHVIEGADTVQRHLQEMLGCASIKIFHSTACVEQDAISDLSDGQKTITDRLQRLVTSGGDEAAVSDVLQKLGDKISEMERGCRTYAPKNPGPIKRKQDELAEIEKRLSKARDRVAQVSLLEEEIQASEGRVEEIHANLETLCALKNRCDDRFKWEEDLGTWGSKEAELDKTIARVREAQARISEIDETLEQDFFNFDALDETAEQQIRDSRQRATLLREEIESGERRLDRFRSEQDETGRPRRVVPIAPLACLGLSVLFIVLGLVVGFARSLAAGILIAMVGLLAGGGAVVWVVISLRRLDPSLSDAQIDNLEQELSQKRDRLDRLTDELTQALDAFRCSSWRDFSHKCSRYRELLSEREQARTRYDTLLDDQSLEALASQREEASRNRRDAEERLGEPAMRQAVRVTPQEYEKMVQEIDRLEGDRKLIQEKLLGSRALSRDPAHTVEDVHRLQERKATITRSLDRLRERLAVYRLTRTVLQEAKDQAMRSARDELEPRIAAHLAHLTQGRYARVRADEELNLRVLSSQKDRWVAADSPELSSGTLDQLYLAVRLALVELLYQDARPPLLLDDPFVKFDATRRQHALILCKEIAQVHQVLLFTCHDHYDSAADWIIELDRPS